MDQIGFVWNGQGSTRVTFDRMATEHFTTLTQTLPRLRHLLSQMEPTQHAESVAEIDARFLLEGGIEAVLWDVDGTLMAYHAEDVDPVYPHIRTMFESGPARHAILSNCDEKRFEVLGEMFSEVPLIRGYQDGDGFVFRHRVRGVDTHTPEQVADLLRGGRQLRKPSSQLIKYGMEVLEATDPQRVLMVGDQYLTDIASANLAGARSVKVPTFKRDTFPPLIQASQRLEALLYSLLYRKTA